MQTDILLMTLAFAVIITVAALIGVRFTQKRRFLKREIGIVFVGAWGIALSVTTVFWNTSIRHADAPTSRLRPTTTDAEIVPVEQESVADKTAKEQEKAKSEQDARKKNFNTLAPKEAP